MTALPIRNTAFQSIESLDRDYTEVPASPKATGFAEAKSLETADALAARANALNASHGDQSALDILDHAINHVFRGRIALVSSFGAEAAVLLDLVATVNPATPVIFLETGKHFAQTLSYRKKLARTLGLSDVRDIVPNPDRLQKVDPKGDLWRQSPDQCCDLRKTQPLKETLEGFDSWITGRKQFHGVTRQGLPVFEASDPFIKVNPLARWRPEDVDAQFAARDLPVHPLVGEGFPSIGCWPCTHPAEDGDVRGGRWRGQAKTECGIHKF
ncbi:MAG: phosphoadenylyl-sulfate reductase [Pseudomonadota bacterium]